MGIDIKVTDNFGQLATAFPDAINKALEECGLTGEGYAKKLCPVDTGNLRNSITHQVVESEKTCYIGSDSKYSGYVELGTGVYYSGGRKTPWVYQDSKGNWHMTNGQRAQPYLKPAISDHANTYKQIIESNMKNG